MKLALLGVGLIGGSIGMAARERLGAEVSGFDPERSRLDAGLELGALDRSAASLQEAVAGADLVFCAAPVGALPGLVAEALAASPETAVVTDVGSTKRDLVEAVTRGGGAERFIGGHPLAGAETEGVENARPDLFDGAGWYLVPTESARDDLFERLRGTLAELGARPRAIGATEHDRMMAVVSHLPHVLANALVSQAAGSLAAEEQRQLEIGRSFRDSSRVAGANPRMWADIFASNADAVAEQIDGVVERLQHAAGLLREGDRGAIEAWQAGAAGDRGRVEPGDADAGPLTELRIAIAHRPGAVAEIALALGGAGVNIEDMSLFPASERRTGAVSVWVSGRAEAERAAEIVRDLGHGASLVGSTR